jgi:hypothetical protein
MKKKISVIATMVLMASTLGLGINQAKADPGSCDASNPCGTYAVVNSAGIVQDILTCQAAVCGSDGQWGARMPSDTNCPGCQIVYQVPANPVTHTPQGGFYTPQGATVNEIVSYNNVIQKFVKGSVPVVKTETFEDGTTITTLQTTVMSEAVTFGPEDFINGEMKFTPVIEDNTGAQLYVYQFKDNAEQIQRLTFSSPKTKDEITYEVALHNFALMFNNLQFFWGMLDNWLLPTP